jgi:RNA polymerase sigma-70 factor (ECF subfamily)
MEDRKQKFTKAYNEYGDAIFRYCFFKISNREKALDFVSETFTRTWQYLLSGNEIENMKTFLYTTARHIIIDEYRKKKTTSLDDLIDQGIEPYLEIEESLYTSLDIERVMEYVHKLPEKYSSIIVMRYVDDLSVKDIAVIINETENVISVRIHRGIAKLRELIVTP